MSQLSYSYLRRMSHFQLDYSNIAYDVKLLILNVVVADAAAVAMMLMKGQ